jgi:hypothetical protein
VKSNVCPTSLRAKTIGKILLGGIICPHENVWTYKWPYDGQVEAFIRTLLSTHIEKII